MVSQCLLSLSWDSCIVLDDVTDIICKIECTLANSVAQVKHSCQIKPCNQQHHTNPTISIN